MKSRRGFTLLEVLVATTIMGVAVVTLLSALSTSVRNATRLTDYDRAALLARAKMDALLVDPALPRRVGVGAVVKTNDRWMWNGRVAGAQHVVEQQLEGFMPVIAMYGATPEERPNQKMPFFQGGPQSMRFVSSYSLQEGARGYPRILEFQVIPGENGKGVRLIVNENLYTGPPSAGMFCLGRVDGMFR